MENKEFFGESVTAIKEANATATKPKNRAASTKKLINGGGVTTNSGGKGFVHTISTA